MAISADMKGKFEKMYEDADVDKKTISFSFKALPEVIISMTHSTMPLGQSTL